jgi:hypothetical protein
MDGIAVRGIAHERIEIVAVRGRGLRAVADDLEIGP